MMKAAPSATFDVSEPDLLFELLIITLDAPAQLSQIDACGRALLDADLKGSVPNHLQE
jgi:hypothetical protein